MKNGFYVILTLAAPGFFGLVLPPGGRRGAQFWYGWALNLKSGTVVLCHVANKMAQKKFKYSNLSCDDVTNYSDTCAKLCEKVQKWDYFKNWDCES